MTPLAAALVSGLLAQVPLPVQPRDSARIEVDASWGGVAREGAWTEARLRVASAVGGPLAIEVIGSEIALSRALAIEAGVPREVRIPVGPVRGESAALIVRMPGGEAVERSLRFQRARPDQRVVAVPAAIELAPGWPSSAWRPVVVDLESRELPVTVRAFEAVDLLLLDEATVERLSPGQVAALEARLASCGRVVSVGLAPAREARWRQLAGCGGAFFRAQAPGLPVEPVLAALLAAEPDPLAGPSEILSAAPASSVRSPAIALAAFLAIYLAILLVASAVAARPTAMVALALGASALLLTAARLAPPRSTVLAWSESTTGSATARVAALLRIEAMSPRPVLLELPSTLDVPVPLDGRPIALSVDGDAPTAMQIRVECALFSPRLLSWSAVVAAPGALALSEESGRPRVVNVGSDPSPDGYLRWQGRLFGVPSLRPGAGASPTEGAPLSGLALPGWLGAWGRRRAQTGLLVPGVPEGLPLPLPLDGATGWLVLHER
jgi:hypothetical protein